MSVCAQDNMPLHNLQRAVGSVVTQQEMWDEQSRWSLVRAATYNTKWNTLFTALIIHAYKIMCYC